MILFCSTTFFSQKDHRAQQWSSAERQRPWCTLGKTSGKNAVDMNKRHHSLLHGWDTLPHLTDCRSSKGPRSVRGGERRERELFFFFKSSGSSQCGGLLPKVRWWSHVGGGDKVGHLTRGRGGHVMLCTQEVFHNQQQQQHSFPCCLAPNKEPPLIWCTLAPQQHWAANRKPISSKQHRYNFWYLHFLPLCICTQVLPSESTSHERTCWKILLVAFIFVHL